MWKQPVTDSDFDEASDDKKKKNENLKTSPNAEPVSSPVGALRKTKAKRIVSLEKQQKNLRRFHTMRR